MKRTKPLSEYRRTKPLSEGKRTTPLSDSRLQERGLVAADAPLDFINCELRSDIAGYVDADQSLTINTIRIVGLT